MHMYGDCKKDARIQECTAAKFTAATRVVAVVQYDSDSENLRAASVNAAYALKETLKNHADLYNIAGFNCEHFAVLCRSGLTRYDSSTARIADILQHECQQPSTKLHKFGKNCGLQDVFRTSSEGP